MLARAKVNGFRFFGDKHVGTKFTSLLLVIAVAKRLVGRKAARAPRIFFASFEFNSDRSRSCTLWLVHDST